jgi:hypothetical protein
VGDMSGAGGGGGRYTRGWRSEGGSAEVGRRLEVAVLEQWRLEPAAARRHACEEERERRCSRDCVGYVGLGPFWIRWGERDVRRWNNVPREEATTKGTTKRIDVLWMADGRIRNHFSLFK